jgi:hypothetical protein
MVHPGRETSTHYFSCLGGTGTNSTKMRRDTLRQICVFASGGFCKSRSAFWCLQGTKHRRIFLMLWWGWCIFHKKCVGQVTLNMCFASGRICGSRCALRCFWGVTRRCTIILARVGLVRIPEKVRRDMLRQTFVFSSDGICGSHCAFQCLWCMKHQHNIFLARV